MDILFSYGKYGVVDSGKTGGRHNSVEILPSGAIRTLGTHMTLALAKFAAQSYNAGNLNVNTSTLDEFDDSVPVPAVTPVAEVPTEKTIFTKKIGSIRVTVSKVQPE